MLGRRGWRTLVASLLGLCAAVVPLAHASAAAPIDENAKTLLLSLPGPFNGCGYLDAGATATSDAVRRSFTNSRSPHPHHARGPCPR